MLLLIFIKIILLFYFICLFFSLTLFLFFHVPECSVLRVLSRMLLKRERGAENGSLGTSSQR